MAGMYTNYAIQVADATTISGISAISANAGAQKIIQGSDGEAYFRFGALELADPGFSATSFHIEEVLDAISVDGTTLPALGSAIVGYNFVTSGGTRTATSGVKITMTAPAGGIGGMTVPRSLTASHGGGGATIDFDVIGLSSDGLTHPFTIGSDISGITPTGVSEIFTVGPANINSTQITDIQSITIDFGIQLITRRADGHAYPTDVGIITWKPMITITSRSLSQLAASGGFVGSSTGTAEVYLRSITDGGAPAADATAAHCKFTVNEPHYIVDTANAAQGALGSESVTIECLYDGSNAPLIFAGDSAIT